MMAYQSTAEGDPSESAVHEGLRLVKSFRRIKDPAHRQKLLELAEQFAVQAERITAAPAGRSRRDGALGG
jgi:hypothetical protein